MQLYFFNKLIGDNLFNFNIILIKIKFIFNFFNILKFKNILYKNYKFVKFNIINKIILCLECHNGCNYNLYPEIYKIPIIKNQKLNYIKNCILSYKNFNRKSIYMNFIVKYLNNTDISNILNFIKNDKFER